LWYHHDVELEEMDNLLPFEKDLYVTMLVQKVEEENEKLRLKEQERRVARKLGKR